MGEERSPQAIDYRTELFMASDDGPFWCATEDPNGGDRFAEDAVAFVATFIGPFEDGLTVERVTGRVEQTGEGPYFHKDEESELEFWELES